MEGKVYRDVIPSEILEVAAYMDKLQMTDQRELILLNRLILHIDRGIDIISIYLKLKSIY